MASYFDEHNCGETQGRNHTLDLLMLARIFLREEGIVERDIPSLDELKAPPAAKKFVAGLPRKSIENCLTKVNNCPICLEHYEKEEIIIELPCLHWFHEHCILSWLNKASLCPVCRHELPTDNPEYEEIRLRKIREKDRRNRVELLHSAMFS